MTKREVAALCCKVLGIYAFIGALNALPTIFILFAIVNSSSGVTHVERASHLGAIIGAVPVVLNILAALFLWLRADHLAGRMGQDTGTDVHPAVVGPEAQIVAFSTLGLYTLLQVIPRIGNIATNLIIMSKQDALTSRNFTGMTAPDISALIIQLSLGLWLLLSASGLVRLLQSFRTVGMDRHGQAAANTS